MNYELLTTNGCQVQFAPAAAKRLAEWALSEATAGRTRPPIGQTFPLEQSADTASHDKARKVVGKTLLII